MRQQTTQFKWYFKLGDVIERAPETGEGVSPWTRAKEKWFYGGKK